MIQNAAIYHIIEIIKCTFIRYRYIMIFIQRGYFVRLYMYIIYLFRVIVVYWYIPISPSWRIYASENWIIIGSGNGLSPVQPQPLPEPTLIYYQLNH